MTYTKLSKYSQIKNRFNMLRAYNSWFLLFHKENWKTEDYLGQFML